MKKLFLAIVLFGLVGCTGRTEFGDCKGLFENQDPDKIYEMDLGNVIVGAILFETVIAPAIVVVDRTYCPVGNKDENVSR